jgi:hypothetical protein
MKTTSISSLPFGFLPFLVLLVPAISCPAALLSYEGFDYPSGSAIVGQSGGFGFSQAWQPNGSVGVLTNQGYSLSYTDPQGNRLVTVGGSLFLQGSITNSPDVATQPNRLLSYSRGTNAGGTDSTTTWVSFLALRQGPTTNNPSVPNNPYPRSANLSLYNSVPSNTEKLAMGNTALTTSNVVSLLPAGANTKASSVSYSQTNLIVVRIDHLAGPTLDNAYLFVNPSLASEPALSQADTNSIGQFDFSFNRIRPFAGGDRPSAASPCAELILDEIRIGETYADVAPYVPPLSIARIGGEVILSWPGSPAKLQAAGTITGAYTNVSGATSPYTNNLAGPQLFFRLSN